MSKEEPSHSNNGHIEFHSNGSHSGNGQKKPKSETEPEDKPEIHIEIEEDAKWQDEPIEASHISAATSFKLRLFALLFAFFAGCWCFFNALMTTVYTAATIATLYRRPHVRQFMLRYTRATIRWFVITIGCALMAFSPALGIALIIKFFLPRVEASQRGFFFDFFNSQLRRK